LQELKKHPYYSSKLFETNGNLESKGTGIFMMKECAKVHRAHKERKQHHLAKRLASQIDNLEESKSNRQEPDKRLNVGDGKWKQPAASATILGQQRQ
jgi:hypothetical protein